MPLIRSSGTLRVGEKLEFRLDFNPVKDTSLDNSSLSMVIGGKVIYPIRITGCGIRPAVSFSFLHHDFGPCYISSPGVPPVVETMTLRLQNNDGLSRYNIDCSFNKTRVLDVILPPTVLEPGDYVDIPIQFSPRAAEKYEIKVPFIVNGSSTVIVTVLGQGIAPKLELSDPSRTFISFGQVSEGSRNTRKLTVVNRARKAITFELTDGLEEKKKIDGAEGETLPGPLEKCDILLMPQFPITVEARSSVPIEVSFAPKKRVTNFSNDVGIKYLGLTKKLLTVSGCCIGYDISLETDAIPFRTVCIGSSKKRKLLLSNSGELSARFRWEERTFGPHISISPLEGTISSFSDVNFEVTFKPVEVNPDIRAENIQLLVEGVGPLNLTCSGSCEGLPDSSIETLTFTSKARVPSSQTVIIKNDSDKDWYLAPVLTGNDWKCSDECKVKANGSTDFLLTYIPNTMTVSDTFADDRETNNHTGNLFIPLPTGGALLYNLVGSASDPPREPLISTSTTAKAPLMIALPVRNWMNKNQRFNVEIIPQLEDGQEELSKAISWNGVKTFEIPPLLTRDYNLRFSSLLEGVYKVEVKFLNIDTGEYMIFDIVTKVSPPAILDTINMESPVRQSSRYMITVDNPLPPTQNITFPEGDESFFKCNNPFIILRPVGTITGSSEGVFEIEYRPLYMHKNSSDVYIEEEETEISFRINELGDYRYTLKLKALLPTFEPSLSFEALLGSSESKIFTFKAYNNAPAKFNCSVSKPRFFQVNANIDVEPTGWDGVDVKVEVNYEPDSVENTTDELVIDGGADWGVYKCKLIGSTKSPTPQGPFRFIGNGNQEIPFKNVFNEQCEFSFVVDNPNFSVGKTSEVIPAKTAKTISVSYNNSTGSGKAQAKLIVTAKDKPNLPSWIFYLHGSSE